MKVTKITKFLLVILTFATIIWLGGSITRAVVAYSMFIPATELEFQPGQSDEIKLNTVKIYSDTAIYTTVSFAIVFFSVIIFFVICKKELKIYGWLFMSFVLFFLASPVELYLTYLDIKLMLYINYSQTLSFSDREVTEFFLNRLKNLNVISPLAYLSFFTSIILLIYKPLDRRNKIETEAKNEND